MPSHHATLRHVRIAAAMLVALLAAGCVHPLAVQDEFFAPMGGTADRIGRQAEQTVRHHRALQAAQRACDASSPAAAAADIAPDPPSGPSPGAEAAREALADLCATPVRPPVAAHGATSNAYQRWVDDGVKALQGSAGAAGGS